MNSTDLHKVVKEVIAESTKVNFGGHSFLLKVDTNSDPTKSGVRVSFIPTQFGQISVTRQNDIAIELESRLERGLSEYGLRVERDRAVKDKTVIRFFIYVEYFDRLIRKALQGQNPDQSSEDQSENSAKLPETHDIK